MASDATTWGSANAEDLFQIATLIAGFDRAELMLEIHRRVRGRRALRVNEATVLQAMQTISDRGRVQPSTATIGSRVTVGGANGRIVAAFGRRVRVRLDGGAGTITCDASAVSP